MQFLLEKFVYLLMYTLARPVFACLHSAALQRAWADLLAHLMPWKAGQQVSTVQVAGVPCTRRRSSPVGGGDFRVLYLHGGWHCIGGEITHRPITSRLADETGATVLLPDYRLAPEHPGPAALEDVLAVYRVLSREPGPLVVAGDSAGGGLALALAQAARNEGLEPPRALYLISPFVDLTRSGASHRERQWRECLLSQGLFDYAGAAYLAGQPANDPRYSPLFGDLSGLPPTLIQVGSEEMLYDDAVLLAERMRSAGSAVELEEFPGLWHVFPVQAGLIRRGARALSGAASFLQHHALRDAG